MTYLRTTRAETPVLYGPEESFLIGGSKVLKRSTADRITIVGAGITLHQALAAVDLLAADGIMARLIDLYSVKPVDRATLQTAARETGRIVTVEDHFAEGGIGEAVAHALADTTCPVHLLAVTRKPRSGKPDELLDYEGIATGDRGKGPRPGIGTRSPPLPGESRRGAGYPGSIFAGRWT
jgi:transketolase